MTADRSLQPHPGLGFGLVTTAAAIWGTGGIAAVIVGTNSTMSYPAINGLRQLAGGLIVLAVVAATGELRRLPRTRQSWRHIVLTGALTALLGGTFFSSLPYIGVAVATVVSLGSAPIFVAIHTAFATRRPPSLKVSAALTCALGGLLLVSDVSATPATDSPSAAIGLALALASGLAFAATTIINRQVVAGLSVRNLIAASFTVSGVIATIWGAGTGLNLESLNSDAWLALAYLAAVHTALGFLAYYAGLHAGVPATSAAILILVEPVTATVIAYLVLAESLTVRSVLGIAMILAAVLLVRPGPPVRAGSRVASVAEG